MIHHIYLSKGESLRIRSRGYSNKNKNFKPGDLVWLYIPTVKKSQLNWNGPFTVIRRVGNLCYIIQPFLTLGKEIFTHYSRLKLCQADITQVKEHF